METVFPTLMDFVRLPVAEQLKFLVCKTEEALPHPDPEVIYYRIADFYVRVSIGLSPLRVERVEALSPKEFSRIRNAQIAA